MPSHSLPTPMTPLVGRAQELADVQRLLARAEVRFVTLTGPGGVGKTRLALQVAEEVAHRFSDGVHFIPLASIHDPERVIPVIAQALGLWEAGEPSLLERLKAYPFGERLLILDNFEQVRRAAPQVAELLAACKGLKVLATSRAPLGLSGEHEFAVPPLALPDPRHLPEAEALLRYGAVALFMQRATAIRPELQISPANAAAIAEICSRLDGLPLALELAAGRAKLFPPRAMLARLDKRLDLLTSGAQDLPARQQSLRSAIAWSYDLLEPGQQQLFRRLGVCVGGCSLEAAQAVGGLMEGATQSTRMDEVAALVDSSLLRSTAGDDGEPRLSMLETIREYALERLELSGEGERVRRAHCAYYLALAERAELELMGPEQEHWLAALDVDHDNVRAALQWSLERREVEFALRLAAAMWRFWLARGYLHEGRQWLRQALDSGECAAAVRAKALAGSSILLHYSGNYGLAATLGGESLRLFRQLNDKQGIAFVLMVLGRIENLVRGNFAAARTMLDESLTLFQEAGDAGGMAETLFVMGMTDYLERQYGPARAHFQASLEKGTSLGDRRIMANALNLLAAVAVEEGDYTSARPLVEKALAIFDAMGDRRGRARALNILGDLAFGQGQYSAARTFYAEGLALAHQMGDKYFTTVCLGGLAGLATVLGQTDHAARLFGALETVREDITALPPARTRYEQMVSAARESAPETAIARAWAEGRTLTPAQALAAATGDTTSPAEETEPTREQASIPARSVFPAGLSGREVEVLRLVASGMSDAEVAGQLHLSPRTINSHLRSIYGKLGVASRTAAAHFAVEHQLI